LPGTKSYFITGIKGAFPSEIISSSGEIISTSLEIHIIFILYYKFKRGIPQ
jgi:hypothetical protein